MIDMVDDAREMAKTGVQEVIARIKDLRARYAAVFNPTLPEAFDVWRFQEVALSSKSLQASNSGGMRGTTIRAACTTTACSTLPSTRWPGRSPGTRVTTLTLPWQSRTLRAR
jgi:hypothetical protein